MIEKERHLFLDVRRVDHVIVVEHEHDIVRHSTQPVEQRGQDRLDRRRLGLLQQGERRAGRGCRPRQ